MKQRALRLSGLSRTQRLIVRMVMNILTFLNVTNLPWQPQLHLENASRSPRVPPMWVEQKYGPFEQTSHAPVPPRHVPAPRRNIAPLPRRIQELLRLRFRPWQYLGLTIPFAGRDCCRSSALLASGLVAPSPWALWGVNQAQSPHRSSETRWERRAVSHLSRYMLVALERWSGATLVQSGDQAMISHLVLTAFLAPFCAFLSKRYVCATTEIGKGLHKTTSCAEVDGAIK